MEVLLSLYELYLILLLLKTLKTYAENLKTFTRGSSAVPWFECVYVRDVPEESEDLFNIVYFFDIII